MALILTLYRSGRRADALRTCQTFRRRLLEDLGMEPSGGVTLLEGQVLHEDPALDAQDRARSRDAVASSASPAVPGRATTGVDTDR